MLVSIKIIQDILLSNESNTFTNIIKIGWWFNNWIEKICFIDEYFSWFITPKIEKVMLKKFLINHQTYFFLFELCKLFSYNILIWLWWNRYFKLKNISDSQLTIIKHLVDFVIVFDYPFLNFWNEVSIKISGCCKLL